MVEASSSLTEPLSVAACADDAGGRVGGGGRGLGRGGEVEHRAIGGAGAADRLDLEVVLGAGRQGAQRGLSVVLEFPVAVAGLDRSPTVAPEQLRSSSRCCSRR